MRALYLQQGFPDSGELSVTGEKHHHLVNVVRAKKQQEILLLDGKGRMGRSVIESIDKKSMKIVVQSVKKAPIPRTELAVAFALPKKDAFEAALRVCVEVGAREIIALQSQRSQTYLVNEQRAQKMIAAAVEQSNNPFYPKFSAIKLKDLKVSSYETAALATFSTGNEFTEPLRDCLLIIGPEGGFSDEEERSLLSEENVRALSCGGPILRTQNAIPYFSGYLKRLQMEVVES